MFKMLSPSSKLFLIHFYFHIHVVSEIRILSLSSKQIHIYLFLSEVFQCVHFQMNSVLLSSISVENRVAQSVGIWGLDPSIARDLIDSEDPKQTLFCREIAFVAIYALFRDDISIL